MKLHRRVTRLELSVSELARSPLPRNDNEVAPAFDLLDRPLEVEELSREVATYGIQVSPWVIRKLIRQGRLPATRVGRLRSTPRALMAALGGGK